LACSDRNIIAVFSSENQWSTPRICTEFYAWNKSSVHTGVLAIILALAKDLLLYNAMKSRTRATIQNIFWQIEKTRDKSPTFWLINLSASDSKF